MYASPAPAGLGRALNHAPVSLSAFRSAASAKTFETLLASVRKIATEIAAPNSLEVDKQGRFPSETIKALKAAELMSACVPRTFGGAGCTVSELTQLCAVLAQACGSSAMVLAMHYSQLACIARHGLQSSYFRQYLADAVKHQHLLASMTSEVGTYGETRTSICAVECDGDRFSLVKDATTGSYCQYADAILVTARKDKQAAPSDQVLVLVLPQDCDITQTTSWDTMGMRGTCSPGFKLVSQGSVEQILPGSYAESAPQTMMPFSHILWASLWWGIAADAVGKASQFVRNQARQSPGTLPPTAMRLADASLALQTMKQSWQSAASAIDAVDADAEQSGSREELSSMGWALRLNNLKVSCSEAAPKIVHAALQIVGVLGYKNDSPFSLGRQYRDVLSASLMISNDRIAAKSASMLLVFKDTA
jgi:acyl-CoA dehydrogenase